MTKTFARRAGLCAVAALAAGPGSRGRAQDAPRPGRRRRRARPASP